MAAMDFDATSTPEDIVSDLGLAVGTTYVGQNISTTATLFTRPSNTAVTVANRAFRVEAGGVFTLTPETGVEVFVWTDDENGCPVIVDKAP